jgi:hypothetical protein
LAYLADLDIALNNPYGCSLECQDLAGEGWSRDKVHTLLPKDKFDAGQDLLYQGWGYFLGFTLPTDLPSFEELDIVYSRKALNLVCSLLVPMSLSMGNLVNSILQVHLHCLQPKVDNETVPSIPRNPFKFQKKVKVTSWNPSG